MIVILNMISFCLMLLASLSCMQIGRECKSENAKRLKELDESLDYLESLVHKNMGSEVNENVLPMQNIQSVDNVQSDKSGESEQGKDMFNVPTFKFS